MVHIKLWIMTYGVVIFAWLLFGFGIGFSIWAGLSKERKALKFVVGMFLIGLTFGLFVYLSLPMQWKLLANIGGL